jgi:hypothetical protein
MLRKLPKRPRGWTFPMTLVSTRKSRALPDLETIYNVICNPSCPLNFLSFGLGEQEDSQEAETCSKMQNSPLHSSRVSSDPGESAATI